MCVPFTYSSGFKPIKPRFIRVSSVPDPYHFYGDLEPDPAFQFDADPDPTFHSDAELYPDLTFQFDADPEPGPTTHFFPDLDPPMLQMSL